MIIRVEFRWIQPRDDALERRVVAGIAVHLPEPAGVPQLVAEILAALNAVDLKANVLPLRRDGNDAEAQPVRAVRVDQVERVG